MPLMALSACSSTVNILARDEFVDEFNTHVSEVFEKRVEHEIGRVLKG